MTPPPPTLIDRASADGYSMMLLSDWGLDIIQTMSPSALASYQANLNQVVAEANAKGIRIVASIYPFGYSGAILLLDKNLAEGQQVVGANFVVSGDRTQLVFNGASSGALGLSNGGFENPAGGSFPGWSIIGPARVFADSTVVHSGSTAARIDAGSGAGRLTATINVQPYRFRRCHSSYNVASTMFDSRITRRPARCESLSLHVGGKRNGGSTFARCCDRAAARPARDVQHFAVAPTKRKT